jgi:hypothetical protein
MTYDDRLRASEWEVCPAVAAEARALIAAEHYAKGASNTYCYLHGLFRKECETLFGVAWWLPPTRVAAESVNREHWTRVLALSRLVVAPGVPKNAASFLLSRSVKLIKAEGRFVSLVTYADTEQKHTGGIYRAANWNYVGVTKPSPVWVDATGKRVARKATHSRSNAQMLEAGCTHLGNFPKHKFTLHLPVSVLTPDTPQHEDPFA